MGNDTLGAPDSDECINSTVNVLECVGRRDLHADAGLALGDHREAEADDKDAVLEHLVRKLIERTANEQSHR